MSKPKVPHFDGTVLVLQRWITTEGIVPPSLQAELRRNVNHVLTKLAELQATVEQLQEQLTDATRAGTPYWRERDLQNGLILKVQDLQATVDRLRGVIRRNTDPMDATPEDGTIIQTVLDEFEAAEERMRA